MCFASIAGIEALGTFLLFQQGRWGIIQTETVCQAPSPELR